MDTDGENTDVAVKNGCGDINTGNRVAMPACEAGVRDGVGVLVAGIDVTSMTSSGSSSSGDAPRLQAESIPIRKIIANNRNFLILGIKINPLPMTARFVYYNQSSQNAPDDSGTLTR